MQSITVMEEHNRLPPLMTAREVAAYLRVSLRRFEQLVAAGEAPPFKRIGRLRRWLRDDVVRWVRDRRAPPDPG